MTFEKAVRFVEPLSASEVAKKADFFAPEAQPSKKCDNEPRSVSPVRRSSDPIFPILGHVFASLTSQHSTPVTHPHATSALYDPLLAAGEGLEAIFATFQSKPE